MTIGLSYVAKQPAQPRNIHIQQVAHINIFQSDLV